LDRLAGAPISWGVCEVPGWGRMLPVDRVLAEMASVGLSATELGAPGFLPDEPDALEAKLDEFGLRLVGGFVALVLHDPAQAESTLDQARAAAARFEQAGGDVFVTAAVVDQGWAPRVSLDRAQWHHVGRMLARLDDLMGERGLAHAVHPHVGTLIETADDIEHVMQHDDARWCLDTGHLAIGGVDPVAFAREVGDRVVHVHLKDVDLSLAELVSSSELSLLSAVRRGLFRPLGAGDLAIGDVVGALEATAYDGWYVLEQDTAIIGDEPRAGGGPIDDVRQSVDHLRTVVAPRVGGLTAPTYEGRSTG
jgi:inosose dehydratase